MKAHSPSLTVCITKIVKTFAATLRQHGYHLTLVAVDETNHWEDDLLGGRVDGCICLHSFPEKAAPLIQRSNRPVVLLNGHSALASGSISVDDRHGATLLTQHLLDLGHRHILMFTDTQRETPHYSIGERQTGFLQCMRNSGFKDAQPQCFEGNADAFAQAWASMSVHPTAVICYSHVEAVQALRVLRRAGVDVPTQVSLATFNDVFPVAELDPALTCVAVHSAEIGRVGGQMLLTLLESNPAAMPPEFQSEITITPTLIERESTTPPPQA